MEFKLQFNVPSSEVKIAYTDRVFLSGSCFAENISEKLHTYKFSAFANSHGILFNPKSICRALEDVMKKREYEPEDLFYHNECWSSWMHHSSFSNPSQAHCLVNINSSIKRAHTHLKEAKWLVITLGSAFTYRHLKSNLIVANCHKVPQAEFEKVLLNKDELKTDYLQLIDELKKFNPNLKIVFTVSPVRYVRDGLVENNLSKAVLLQLVHELCVEKKLVYFPAYELVMDELRDYRFYKSDMVHPNNFAIDYVWKRFTETFFSEETNKIYTQLEDIVKAVHHKPFHEETNSHQKFKSQYLTKVKRLSEEYPFLRLEEEIKSFS